MMLGPGPSSKKPNRDRTKTESTRKLGTGGMGSSTNTGTSSADTVVVDDTNGLEQDQERRSDVGWNRRRYQREDEFLWGLDGSDDNSAPGTRSHNGSTYYVARNPAVNDLHPPVVSTQPTHRSETRWMLQPPPSAKVMEGKEKANRSRSGSGSTTGSGKRAAGRGLGRKVGERLMEEKVKRGDYILVSASASTRSRGLSRESARSDTPAGQSHDRQPRSSNGLDDPSKNPEITITSSHSQSPTLTILTRTPSSTSRPLPFRPPLSTVPSASLQSSPGKPRPPNVRPLVLSSSSASSLGALQAADMSELNSKQGGLDVSAGKGYGENRSISPLPEARVKLPEAEEDELRVPEVESWWPSTGYEFPTSVQKGGSL